MDIERFIELGKTGIKISPLGLGAMQWGDVKLPSSSSPQPDHKIKEIFQISTSSGINFIDTAEMYGNGKSERHMGMLLGGETGDLIIATKFMPFPWRLSKRDLRSALMNSLGRLGLPHIDLYQMHWPFPPVPIKTWMDAMSDAIADGLIRAVGVSNYSVQQVEQAQEALAKHQIPLASNQVKFSILDQHPISSGLLDYCRKSGVTIIAYSPLEKGILTGKFTPDNPPTGFRAWRYNRSFLSKIAPLFDVLHDIGEQNGGKTPAQVSLNWLMVKGAVPIPGARHIDQASKNAAAMGWQMTPQQVATLDQISAKIMQ